MFELVAALVGVCAKIPGIEPGATFPAKVYGAEFGSLRPE